MSRLLLAVTNPSPPGVSYPPYFNFSETGPCEVTLIVRTAERKPPHPAPDYPLAGQDVSFVLGMDEVVKLSHALNQVIARFTSNA